MATRATPFWENRDNVSGEAGIAGNNQDPANWGPPSLAFSSGIAGLSDAQSSFNRNQTDAWSYSAVVEPRPPQHHVRRRLPPAAIQLPVATKPARHVHVYRRGHRGQRERRGIGGADFADFLLGIPDTSSIAFGNADKYFRESVYDAYVTDDWRISPQFTLNAGLRWEYGAPITELYGRLVNLDIAPGFAAVAPVVASDPVGPLTGQKYPNSLIRPDKRGFEPRVGIAWRPISGSSLLVRAGYGIYYDTSVYQTIALANGAASAALEESERAEQPGLPADAGEWIQCRAPSITPDTFAVDPNFRVGYAQNWQVSVQRDLPGSLQLTATYLGIKGTRGVQEFLPNTFPAGAANPCPAARRDSLISPRTAIPPARRGRFSCGEGCTTDLPRRSLYTYSKSIDDDSALGGQGAVCRHANTPSSPFGGGAGGIGVNTAPSAGSEQPHASRRTGSI